MPRDKRLVPVDLAMHIMSRGNNRQDIFHDDRDKLFYYSLLQEFKNENKITIFHYCLMDNHIHLILWLSNQAKLSRFMKQINLCYFNYYRKTYGYVGHFWQDRFKSNIIDTDSYLLQCGKYIELNPVRAKMVDFPEEYSFSSYKHYAKGVDDSLVTDDPAYLGFSNDKETRRKQYIDFVIDESIINAGKLFKQLFIGSEPFVKKLEEYYSLKNAKRKRGRPRKLEK
ncbi:MAG: transposase [Candidatus Omnitrophota bacterium]|nr:transposase [Candidatus Omnitrophota bacterium]